MISADSGSAFIEFVSIRHGPLLSCFICQPQAISRATSVVRLIWALTMRRRLHTCRKMAAKMVGAASWLFCRVVSPERYHIPPSHYFHNNWKRMRKYKWCRRQSFSIEHHIGALPPNIARWKTIGLFLALNERKELFRLKWRFLIDDIVSCSAYVMPLSAAWLSLELLLKRRVAISCIRARYCWGQKVSANSYPHTLFSFPIHIHCIYQHNPTLYRSWHWWWHYPRAPHQHRGKCREKILSLEGVEVPTCTHVGLVQK